MWLSLDVLELRLVRFNLGLLASTEEGINSALAFAVASHFISLGFSQVYIPTSLFDIKFLGSIMIWRRAVGPELNH